MVELVVGGQPVQDMHAFVVVSRQALAQMATCRALVAVLEPLLDFQVYRWLQVA